MFRKSKPILSFATWLANKCEIQAQVEQTQTEPQQPKGKWKTRLQLPTQTIWMGNDILSKIENPDNYLNHALQKMKIETSSSLCSKIQFDIVESTLPTEWEDGKTYKVFPYIELYDPNPKSDKVKLYFQPKLKPWSTENV